jgi:hypothetical protein
VRGRSAALAALAVASVAAGVIHAAAAPAHLAEDPLLGAAFIAVAIFQVTWALPVTGGAGERVVRVGVVVNVAIVLAWILSRTAGLPIGPHAWSPEAPGGLDVAATVLELSILAGCAVVGDVRDRSKGDLAARPSLRPLPRAPRGPA